MKGFEKIDTMCVTNPNNQPITMKPALKPHASTNSIAETSNFLTDLLTELELNDLDNIFQELNFQNIQNHEYFESSEESQTYNYNATSNGVYAGNFNENSTNEEIYCKTNCRKFIYQAYNQSITIANRYALTLIQANAINLRPVLFKS